MKYIKIIFVSLLAFGCTYDNTAIEAVKPTRLFTEEFLTVDPTAPGGLTTDFKKTYHYDQNKLSSIDATDFNPITNKYESSYKLEDFRYGTDGRLSQHIEYLASPLMWIEEYEYQTPTTTKVSNYLSDGNTFKHLDNWWIMEKTPTTLTVKYYQLNDQLYAELDYQIGANGNVISVTGDPNFPSGKLYFAHDNAPNPYKFPELGGEYGFDSEKFLSENNRTQVTNDANTGSSNIVIEYNKNGYPATITTPAYKTIFTYQ